MYNQPDVLNYLLTLDYFDDIHNHDYPNTYTIYHSVDTDTTVEITREYNGKIDINRLQIKLLDEYGRIVDLDNMDFSLTIKIETE